MGKRQNKSGKPQAPPPAANGAVAAKQSAAAAAAATAAAPAAAPLTWDTLAGLVVVLVAGLAVAWHTNGLLRRMFNQRFSWELLSATDKRLSRAMYSESALYYTFMEEYVEAPSFTAAVATALRDNRTEYPEVINAVSRFNIWQELVVGQLWRSGLSSYFPDPLDLMIESIWFMQGVSYLGIALLAWYLGGANLLSLACSFVALASYAHVAATERMNCFRAVQFPMLRENYSVPCMWYQLLAVAAIVRRDGGRDSSAGGSSTINWSGGGGGIVARLTSVEAALFITSVLMLTAWQFAPFLLLLQVGALLATYIAGYASLQTLARICKVLVRFWFGCGVVREPRDSVGVFSHA
jgi:hypothetical protein